MKSIQSRTWGLLLVVFTLCLPTSSWACDRSSLTLDSLVFDGTSYTLYMELCVGGGILGAAAGAGSPTATFALANYGGSGSIVSFAPPALTSDTLGSTYVGFIYPSPPVSPFISGTGDAASSYLVYFSTSGDFYTCTNSTPQCGVPHSDCDKIIMTMTSLPDSISAIGIEGFGNPAAGCHSIHSADPNITIDLTGYRIFWGGFEVEESETGVALSWTALRERGEATYRAMRQSSYGEWVEIGRLPSQGGAEASRDYTLRDEHPHAGRNIYRIERVTPDGSIDVSARRSIEVAQAPALNWASVGPVPVSDLLTVQFESSIHTDVTLELRNLDGKYLLGKQVVSKVGLNKLDLDLHAVPAGIYLLKLHSAAGTLHRKITKY